MSRVLSTEEVREQLVDHQHWSVSDVLSATFTFDDFRAALAFVNAVGDEAEQMNHHPDIDIRWNKVTLQLVTHDAGGLTQADVELAVAADRIADPERR